MLVKTGLKDPFI